MCTGMIARGRCDGGGQPGRVHVVSAGIDVHEDRAGAHCADCFGGGDEGVGNGNHLVARANADRAQHQLERGGAAGHAHTMRGATVGRKIDFELLDCRPHDEVGGIQHRLDGLIDLWADGWSIRVARLTSGTLEETA